MQSELVRDPDTTLLAGEFIEHLVQQRLGEESMHAPMIGGDIATHRSAGVCSGGPAGGAAERGSLGCSSKQQQWTKRSWPGWHGR